MWGIIGIIVIVFFATKDFFKNSSHNAERYNYAKDHNYDTWTDHKGRLRDVNTGHICWMLSDGDRLYLYDTVTQTRIKTYKGNKDLKIEEIEKYNQESRQSAIENGEPYYSVRFFNEAQNVVEEWNEDIATGYRFTMNYRNYIKTYEFGFAIVFPWVTPGMLYETDENKIRNINTYIYKSLLSGGSKIDLRSSAIYQYTKEDVVQFCKDYNILLNEEIVL